MGGAHAVAIANQPNLPPSTTYAQLDGYLDNLANAASQEKTTLAELVASTISLRVSVTNLTTNLANLTMAYTLLTNGTAAPAPASSTCGGRPHGSGV